MRVRVHRIPLLVLCIVVLLGSSVVRSAGHDVEERLESLEQEIEGIKRQVLLMSRDIDEAMHMISENKEWIDALIDMGNWTITELLAELAKQRDVLDHAVRILEGSLIERAIPPPVVVVAPRSARFGVLYPSTLWTLEGQPYRQDFHSRVSVLHQGSEEWRVGGVVYGNTVAVRNADSGPREARIWFNLGGEVDTIEGFAAVDDASRGGVVMGASVEGTQIFAKQFNPGELPEAFTIDVRGVSVLVLELRVTGDTTLLLMDP